MSIAEETPNRRPKKQFIGEKRRQVWYLFEALMSGDIGAAFGAEKKRHILLCEAGALPIRAYVVG